MDTKNKLKDVMSHFTIYDVKWAINFCFPVKSEPFPKLLLEIYECDFLQKFGAEKCFTAQDIELFFDYYMNKQGVARKKTESALIYLADAMGIKIDKSCYGIEDEKIAFTHWSEDGHPVLEKGDWIYCYRCGKVFQMKTTTDKYCSSRCAYLSWKER